MNTDKFLSKGVVLTGLLAVVPVAQSAPVFTNPDFNLTPVSETIIGSGTFTGGGWEVTSGTLYVSNGVFGFPLPHHLEYGNDSNSTPAASVQQTLARTSTAPGTSYTISFDWNRDFGSINGVQDVGNVQVTFGSNVFNFDPFATSPGTFSASGLLASGASTDLLQQSAVKQGHPFEKHQQPTMVCLVSTASAPCPAATTPAARPRVR